MPLYLRVLPISAEPSTTLRAPKKDETPDPKSPRLWINIDQVAHIEISDTHGVVLRPSNKPHGFVPGVEDVAAFLAALAKQPATTGPSLVRWDGKTFIPDSPPAIVIAAPKK